MDISIGYSPCPNDTYIFYALVHGKIDTGRYRFIPTLADVEALNQMAVQRLLPVTKISFNAYLDLTRDFILLDSGGALGQGCGPLLISTEPKTIMELCEGRIAIPGLKTTANFLLDYFLTCHVTKDVLLFSDIEDAVLSGKVDAGVIIHENRFTYAEKGLYCIQDLGEHWEDNTKSPIPLGGIIADRTMPPDLLRQLSQWIKQSIEYADEHTDEVMLYVKEYAQEMEINVMMQHINLYVNRYSKSLGIKGQRAVEQLFEVAKKAGRITSFLAPFE